MPSFRVTYYTTGGPFSRVIEAETSEAAETTALEALREELLTFTENEVRFTLRTAQVATVSVEEEKTASLVGSRPLGFAGR